MLRDYQKSAIELLYEWLENNDGHPCVVMPTGSGKSIVIAEICRQAITQWPETKIVMLTRSVELITQNAEKLRAIWPGAPMGVYSASAGKKQLGEPITIGGPLSVSRITKKIGHCDLLIVDEAHDISHKDDGSYRKIISDLEELNPALRVIGFTASPYRLGHGMITDKPAIFDALIEPISIEELVNKGYLSILRSKVTGLRLSTAGVHKRGGEFVESELQAAVDTNNNNERVVREVIELAGDRKAWLFFCSGVKHANNVAEVLRDNGISAACVTGDTNKSERLRILSEFRSGRIRAVTNANVLTTGFDYPDIDLIAMLRPTMSPGLYLQMAGRGMRVKSHTDHCLVLDFAGVVETHGPITAVQPPKKNGEGDGEAPVKVCDNCHEICAISASKCPACGHPFPAPDRKELELRNDDIMGLEAHEMPVTSWSWRRHVSRASGKEMLACTYYGAISDRPITEYMPVMHDGYAGQKARRELISIAVSSDNSMSHGINFEQEESLNSLADSMNKRTPPKSIEYRMDGKFFRVLRRVWND